MITGEIVEIEESTEGYKNLIIWICFKKDGVEIPFYKGTEIPTKNGKQVWPLICRYENFIGKTTAQITEWIRLNVEAQIDNIIKYRTCLDTLNIAMTNALKKMKSTMFSKDTTVIPVKVGETIINVELKDDGTYKVV